MSVDGGHEPNFDVDFRYGQAAEHLVSDLIHGLINGRTEVKRDSVTPRTGNLFVEYTCRFNGEWLPSGLAKTEADQWVFIIGDTGIGIVVATDVLKDICRPLRRAGKTAKETDGSHPTEGVLLPLAAVVSHVRSCYARVS